MLRAHLEVYIGADRRADARRRLVELAEMSDSGSGVGGDRWTRDDLYD